MTRETRLVAILFGLSIVGVTTLSFIADQYRKHLAPPVAAVTASPRRDSDAVGALRPDVSPPEAASEDAVARAARKVAGFLAAREAVRGLCAGGDVIATYRAERFKGFAAHGMSYADYVAARTAWRAWRASEPGGDAALRAAFEARRAAAEKAGLGACEALDDAIN